MIAYLKGEILNKGKGYIILLSGGMGYKIHLNQSHLSEVAIGQGAEFYTHQYVREDAMDLFGFRDMEEMELFELLLSISGIGPKSALGVLSIAKPGEIKDSIARGDSHLLTKVSGIGKKTAERVVLELREKVVKSSLAEDPFRAGRQESNAGDEIDALLALGYSFQQAREALSSIGPEASSPAERIRQALRKLGR